MACHHMAAHALTGAGAFFALGLAGGMHCAGMCGPLACLLGRPEQQPWGVLGLYHGSRLAAYAAVGATFAALGSPLRPLLSWPVLALLAGLPLLAFAAFGSDGGPGFLTRWHAAGARRLAGLPPWMRGLGLGVLTPALPCGLLYAAAGGAISAPGPLVGAAWLLAFGAGTLPLLLLGQAGFSWAARRGSPRLQQGLRRGAALLAACTLIYLSFLA
jgi:sulfite exporter TauE/SafE